MFIVFHSTPLYSVFGGVLFSPQLRALTHILHLPVEVIQAESPTIKIGEEYDGETITLV